MNKRKLSMSAVGDKITVLWGFESLHRCPALGIQMCSAWELAYLHMHIPIQSPLMCIHSFNPLHAGMQWCSHSTHSGQMIGQQIFRRKVCCLKVSPSKHDFVNLSAFYRLRYIP